MAGFLVLYLATKAATQTTDTVWYASGVEKGFGPLLFHPHHLLHMPLIWLVWRTINLAAIGLRAIDVAQVVCAVFGAGALVLFRRLLFRIRPLWLLSFTAAVLYGVTSAFWHEATDGEAYPPALFFSLASMYCAIAHTGRRAAAISGLLAGAAFCFHEQALCLVAIPAFHWVVRGARKHDFAETGWFAGSASAWVVTVYASSMFYLRISSLKAAFEWLLRYPITMPEFGVLLPNPLLRSLQGLARNVLFLPHERLSVANVLPCVLFIVAYIAWSWASRRREVTNGVLLSLLIAALLGATFAFWWDPIHHKFWIFPVCSWLLLLCAVARLRRPATIAGCLAIAVFAANFSLYFHWRAITARNPYSAAADAVEGLEKDAWIAFITGDERLRIQMIYFNGYHNTCAAEELSGKIDLREVQDALQKRLPIYLFLSKSDLVKIAQQYLAGQLPRIQQEFCERFMVAPSPEFPLPDGSRGFYRLRLREADDRTDPATSHRRTS